MPEMRLDTNNDGTTSLEMITPNNQDILTTNMQQPIRRFSAGDTPALPDTPINATTGCTTLPSDPHITTIDSTSNQQSVLKGDDVAVAQMIYADLMGEKDPPAPSPDVYIKDFNTPQERVVPTPPNFTEDSYLDILFDGHPSRSGGSAFVEVEDSEGNSLTIGEWLRPTSTKDRYWKLRIPDPRQIQPLKDQILTLTAQNQAFAAANDRLLTQLRNSDQTIKDLRGANTQLLRQILELRDTNRDLVKERHALATALQVANETMRTSIERIMSLIQVIK